MTATKSLEDAISAPFGTVFADQIAIAHYKDGAWSPFEIQPYGPLEMSPAAHVLHYSSSVFEGMKIHKWDDGSLHAFRMHDHFARLRRSAELLCLPVPEAGQLENMLRELVARCRDWCPDQPGSLYVRPTLIGTLDSIGAAAGPSTEACLYILLSPVGDYFKGGLRPLRILIERELRTSPGFGMAKTGGNYASALHRTVEARKKLGIDQVLFAPDDDVQETGAANFFLIGEGKVQTKGLSSAFLHGITRDSLLKLAPLHGYEAVEKDFGVEEVLEFVKTGEAALSGTAAVLAGIGTFIYDGKEYAVSGGEIGEHTLRLRNLLMDIKHGKLEDPFGWTEKI